MMVAEEIPLWRAAPRAFGGVPLVSVVVPTFHRDDLLARLLDKLTAQHFAHAYEIVVVDDARSSTTPAVIDAFARAHPAQCIRMLPGAGRGPAAARNIGWRAA